MKRITKRALSLAAAGVMVSGAFSAAASAATQTWNSTASSDWLTAGNWNTTDPGVGGNIGDTALFGSVDPLAKTVNVNSAVEIGSLLDVTPSSDHALTVNLTGNLTLDGSTATVVEGTSTVTQGNTVLAYVSTSTVTTQNMTVSGGTVVLNNPTNNILVSQGGNGSNVFQTLTIASNITDGAGGSATLNILGQGSGSADGGGVVLSGTNSFTGGMNIGQPDTGGTVQFGTLVGSTQTGQGAQLQVVPSSFPTTGTVTINEESQLALNTPGNYGSSSQTINVYGIGINKNISGAIRTFPGVNGVYNILSNVNIETADATDAASGFPYVVLSPTSVPQRVIQFSGVYGGPGSLIKQGSGAIEYSNANNTNTGGVQIGNGSIVVDAGSSAGTGFLQMSQTSKNFTVAAFDNLTQNVQNLASSFTSGEPANGGGGFGGVQYQQAVFLNGTTEQFDNNSGDANFGNFNPTGTGTGTTLNITEVKVTSSTSNQPQNLTGSSSFGYGRDTSYTSTIQGPGSVVLTAASNGTLTFTGPNLYTGGTTINGGTLNLANRATDNIAGSTSAVGSGNLTVNSGGTLTSGNAATLFTGGTTLTASSGTMSGALIVNSGGVVSPGGVPGSNLVGALNVGSITANKGSIFDFTLAGGLNATNSVIDSSGPVTLDGSGTETVNVSGSQLAVGAYDLMNYPSLAGTGTAFTLVGTPGAANRSYALETTSNELILQIDSTGGDRFWTTNGQNNPYQDGGGTWTVGGTTFYTTGSPGTPNSPWDNTSSADLVIGFGGAGGLITIGSPNVRVGGPLALGAVTTPYTIGAVGGTNTLELGTGISSSASDTINAPIVLDTSETFSVASQISLTINGAITQATGVTASLTKSDIGTLVLTGTSTYSGGTTISQGTLQVTTAALPTTGTLTDNATLAIGQSFSGTFSGKITGTGGVLINNSSPTATVVLSNSANSYASGTTIQNGVLNVTNVNELGGASQGGLTLSGGTLQAGATLSFPFVNANTFFTLIGGTTSTIDTNGFNITMGETTTGSGNLTKIGTGTVTLTSLASTAAIGNLAISGGSTSALVLAPAGNPSWGFSADPGGNTINGNITIANPMELRLWGGVFSGTGNINVAPTGQLIDSEVPTTIGANIVLNSTNAVPNFVLDLGSHATAPLTISGDIEGNGSVDFTSAPGFIYLTGNSTYTGGTTIDNNLGSEVQIDNANALPVTTALDLTHTGLLDLYGVNQQVASLNAGPNAASAVIIDEATASATLSVVGTATTTYNGLLTDGSSTSGFLGLTLGTGNTGTLILTNTNSYSGGTTLNGGTLSVSSDNNLGLPNGALTFGGGTLALTGTAGITSSRPVTVNAGGGTIDIAPGNSFTLNGTAGINWRGGTLALTDTGTATVALTGGTVSVLPSSTLSVAGGMTLAVKGSTDPFSDNTGSENPALHVAIINNGNVSITQTNSSINGITGSGTLTVGDGSTTNTVQLAQNSGTSTQSSLSILGNSTLDITNDRMFITYTPGSDPIASIAAWIKSGAHDVGGVPTWTGDGITSSLLNTTIPGNDALSYGIGYADSADPGNPAQLAANTVEISFTLLGDANLDHKVNGTDFNILAANFNTGGDSWDQGDFTYDGKVNGSDFNLLAQNFNQGATLSSSIAALDSFTAANGISLGSLTSVPEPASIGLLTVATVGILSRRRRRS